MRCNLCTNLTLKTFLSWLSINFNSAKEDLLNYTLGMVDRQPLFYKNLIRNSSGNDEFTGWKFVECERKSWKIEKTPIGCNPIPKTKYTSKSTCCFVSTGSAEWSYMSYLIDLETDGQLARNFLLENLPIKIKCWQMYCVQENYTGKLSWSLKLLDDGKPQEILKEYKINCNVDPSRKWASLRYSFIIHGRSRSNADLSKRLRYLQFQIGGSGDHGTKFCNSIVVLQHIKDKLTWKELTPLGSISPKRQTFLPRPGPSSGASTSTSRLSKVNNIDIQPEKLTTSRKNLQVRIITLTGKKYTFNNVQNSWTIRRLRQEMLKWHGPEADRASFYFKGKRLNDRDTFEALRIPQNALIEANFRSTGGIISKMENLKNSLFT